MTPRLPAQEPVDAKPRSTLTQAAVPTAARSAVKAPSDGFEASATGAAAPKAGTGASSDVQGAFKEQFGALAQDKAKFHDTMRSIFGEGYDAKKAEGYRQQALAGNYDWLPPVKWVGSDVLGGAHGAYDSESGTVFLDKALQGNPALAASTYVEEAGHHLDAKLNTVDSRGDEGELFRRVLGGEKLTRAQVEEIRAENDKGIIHVDGKAMEVEFWNPFKAIGNAVSGAAKAVGNAVSGAAKAVGDAVVNTAKGVVNAAVSVGQGVVGAAKTFGSGIAEGVGGFFTNLVQFKVGDALQSLVRGADKAIFQAPQRLWQGMLDGAEHLVNGASHLLGPLGGPVRAIGSRVIDAGRTVLDTTMGIARDTFRTALEVPVGFIRDVESSIKLAAQGKWGEAAGRFGMAFGNAAIRGVGGIVDGVVRGVQGLVNAGLTLTFAEQPSKPLTQQERDVLKRIYGDSIDYDMVRVKRGGSTDWAGMAAHVVGNTIYMPDSYYDASGNLTKDGIETLAHEAGHVWQNQNGGGDYLHRALLAQGLAALQGGSRNGAYDWREGFAEGKSFDDLNPEQQASLIEDIGKSLLTGNGVVEAEDWDKDLSPAEFQYVMDAWKRVRQGDGAR
jgi:hypothetical protein